jgi:hypothetical protein
MAESAILEGLPLEPVRLNQPKTRGSRIAKTQKELESLRRGPINVSKGETRTSFMATKNLMPRAAEVGKQPDDLKRGELEIRDKLRLRSQQLGMRQAK